MPQAPILQTINVTDSQTVITGSLFNQLQNNISDFVSNYVPLIGGTLLGTLSWNQAQTFPSIDVLVNDAPYPHQGIWSTLNDHIQDSTVHRQPSTPLAHALSHFQGGTDALYSDQISVSSILPATSIKTYVDTSIASASAFSLVNYAPSTQYSIGGPSPLYASNIAVNSSSATTNIKSYVDSSIAALSGSYPLNPTFTNPSTSGKLAFTNPIYITSQGSKVIVGDGTNLHITSSGTNSYIDLGTISSNGSFGSFSSNGYSIGSTQISSTGGAIGGGLSVSNDIVVSRNSTSYPAAGAIRFGSSGAILSYNADIANSFYLSAPITFASSISVATGQSINIANELMISNTATNLNSPGIRSDYNNLFFYSLEAGNIYLGYDNVNLSSIGFGPNNTWGRLDNTGLNIGYSKLSSVNSIIQGNLSVNNAAVVVPGDIGTANTNSSGSIYFGTGYTAALFDYGKTTNNAFTFSLQGHVLSSIGSDGTYNVGGTMLGPNSTILSGTLSVNRGISTQLGILFNGASGYSFNNTVGDTGLFSTGEGDLRLFTAGTPALIFQNNGQIAAFNNSVTVASNITTTNFTASNNAVVQGNLTVSGNLIAAGATIQRFRIKNGQSLGYNIAATSTTYTYPNIVMIGYSGGQIEGIRLSAVGPDTTSIQSSWNILQNGSLIANVSLTQGARTAFAYPITNPTPIFAGDQIQAVCTSAGTSFGVTVSMELSQLIS